MLCRSQTTLRMQFSDLFSLKIENQGVTGCVSLVATIAFGKNNQHGKIEYGSAVRHRQVEVCSTGALTTNLFSRFHYENESFPDFTSRERWYETCVVKGDDSFTPVHCSTQYKAYTKAFKRVGVSISKVTHANRKSALNMIAQEDVAGDQQRRFGRWGTDRMVGCYVSSLPVEAMKSLAGFSGRNVNYFLIRSSVIPPMSLQVLVFPDIEYWQDKFKNNDGVQEDIVGPKFLLLLSYLRVVFLEDSVALKKDHLDYYLWSCSLFQTELYKNFEQQLFSTLQEEEILFNPSQMMQTAMPELVSTLESGFSLMAASMQAMSASHDGSLHIPSSNPVRNTIDTATSTPTASSLPTNAPNRTIVTVTDVWREYTNGSCGGPSVEYLEEFGTAWRKDRKELLFFSRRNEIYKAIKSKADAERTSCEEAVCRLEERRASLCISLDKLRSVIKDDSLNTSN
ncbi:hypothetical protein INT46_000267 [Mucor plumbeus]|uniref:Transcription activator GCR1-like domain-containing protein n=1 Tax=Mucor plumbeus TaxID=97098 RepID=A0A8H7R4Y1_9FUNG|nr:hypothetical protein INT46_000267 [Mucor plumbeus]